MESNITMARRSWNYCDGCCRFTITSHEWFQLFFSEQAEPSDKLKERVKNLATSIIIIYLIFTFICALLLNIAGMSLFDSICHSMTTIATGGYSTQNNSIGHYDSLSIEIVINIWNDYC